MASIFLPVATDLDFTQAACRKPGVAHLFPFPGEQWRTAQLVCNGTGGRGACPIKRDCLAYAIKLPSSTDGIYAGLTEADLRPLRRRREEAEKQARTRGKQRKRPGPSSPMSLTHPSVQHTPDQEVETSQQPPRHSRLEELLIHVAAAKDIGGAVVIDAALHKIVVHGNGALEELAVAIGYTSWNQARRFIDNLVHEGCAQLRLVGFGDHDLEIDCAAIVSRLERIKRSVAISGSQQGRSVTSMSKGPGPADQSGPGRRSESGAKTGRGRSARPPSRSNRQPITDLSPFTHLVRQRQNPPSPPVERPDPLHADWLEAVLAPIAEAGGALGGRSPQHLSKDLRVGLSTATKLLQHLDNQGYIHRSRTGNTSIHMLTPDGLEWLGANCPDILRPLAQKSA